MNITIPTLNGEFYAAALPAFSLGIGSIIAMLQGVSKRFGSERQVLLVILISLITALVGTISCGPAIETTYLSGGYLAGDLSRVGQGLILGISLIVTMMFSSTFLRRKFLRGEIASLFLMVICGMIVMVASDDIITLFIGLELSSIGLYALVGYINPSRRSQEGAIKYFILGAFATSLLLFGFALLYVATGTLRLSEMAQLIPKMIDHNWVRLGVLFALSGLGFKLGLAPFHLWAPDTYEAAPTGITALMATAIKVMVLVVVVRIFTNTLAPVYDVWLPALMFLAMVSMIIGNLMALVQASIKRMLAYSSVAHSGYMAIALCALGGTSSDFPVAALLYYLVGYSIISLGAFSVLMWLENERNDNLLVDDLSGLAKQHPWAAFAMAVFMFSFAGMPPTVGFMGKFFVFNAALSNQLYSLVIIGLIGSAISLFYYLRIIVRMYMSEPVRLAVPLQPKNSWVVSAIIGSAVLTNLALGTVLPEQLLKSLVSSSQEVTAKKATLNPVVLDPKQGANTKNAATDHRKSGGKSSAPTIPRDGVAAL